MGFLRLTGDAARDVESLRGWLDAARPEQLVITTSGSTGVPKEVLLSRDAVLASAEASAARLGGSGSWRLVLPSSYVAGVNVICRCLVAGCEPLLDDTPGGADYISLVPTQLHRMLAGEDTSPVGPLEDFRAVLVGGGPASPELRERAEGAGVRLVATYGSSETCGGCVYDGLPLDGVRVATDDDGRVRLGGPMLFDGYTSAELTAATLVDGWFLTSDLGSVDSDGRLTILGRVDDVVISGGVKVPVGAVAARVAAMPGVTSAEVFGVTDPEWGQRVVAVVAATDATPDLSAVRDWVGGTCPREWAPRQLVVVSSMPLLTNGKHDRLAVRALVEART